MGTSEEEEEEKWTEKLKEIKTEEVKGGGREERAGAGLGWAGGARTGSRGFRVKTFLSSRLEESRLCWSAALPVEGTCVSPVCAWRRLTWQRGAGTPRNQRQRLRAAKMLPEKLLFHVKLLFCMVVVATEGKKKKKNRKQADEPEVASILEAGFNMCDINPPEVIYCYCDVLDLDKAEEGNCWIFNDTSENEYIWEGFMSQTKIKRLTLHLRPDGTLKNIPTVAVLHLPSIEMFEVQYATFKTVRAYSFGNSTTLAKVSLSRNSIATLARNAFTHLPSLDTLSLGENHISEINRHVFADLPKLTKLYIDRNNITIVHDRAFQGLHSLVELDLFSNQIHVITPDTFKGLQSLERLDLHKNRIEVIGDKTFRDLQALRTLDLQENSLKYIAPNGFHGLERLQRLNLQDNKLLTLGSEVFKPAPSILHLDIRANVLETLTLETVQPLLENLNNDTMQFFLEGNNFRCDKRLSWMFSLRNSTRSLSLRRNLDEVICYLEGTTMPPRLAEDETVTPAYETTTLGIAMPRKLPRVYGIGSVWQRGVYASGAFVGRLAFEQHLGKQV
ncbi:hypothetical protein O3P69_008873 [Scylla paramamosain]|uniref:Connectin n=1 Tax=Scylla paramamosain TaxID=85552 RepID=A0AAW0TQ88_SCYPA